LDDAADENGDQTSNKHQGETKSINI